MQTSKEISTQSWAKTANTFVALVDKFHEKRDETLRLAGETLGIAAQAGRFIINARKSGTDVARLCQEADITNEQSKRFERVATHQEKIESGESSSVRQGFLWVGLLPDPITTSEPSEPKPFLTKVIQVSQWLASRGLRRIKQEDDLRKQFLREAKPIVEAYEELSR
jgi:hypothetical protein